jgi:protein-tyrosine phosphatase
MKVLFVCLGNICRSPLAAAIFNHKVKEQKLDWHSDSCGTGNYHIGGSADERSINIAKKNGVNMQHVVRQLTAKDLLEFDHIIAMDKSNLFNILRLSSAKDYQHKIKLMREYDPHGVGDVPDPYYGTEREFKEVYEILDRCIEKFLEESKKRTLAG